MKKKRKKLHISFFNADTLNVYHFAEVIAEFEDKYNIEFIGVVYLN